MVAMGSPACLVDISLAGMGWQAGRRAAPLDIDNEHIEFRQDIFQRVTKLLIVFKLS